MSGKPWVRHLLIASPVPAYSFLHTVASKRFAAGLYSSYPIPANHSLLQVNSFAVP